MASGGRIARGLVIAVLAAATAGSAAAASRAGAAEPSASSVQSIPRVGALFFPSFLGSSLVLRLAHHCTASVVHSPHHDLVLTAAHCIAGNGIGYDFAPGYHDGVTPYGVWSARHVYVDPAWIRSRDPQHDYAFLEVAPTLWHGVHRNVEDVVGAYTLGAAPPSGYHVTVDGYVAGVDDRPITCTSMTYETTGYPSFDCDGFAAGTSGGPWLSGWSVVGVIGGLHQGGCTPQTSYTAAFGSDTLVDWRRAATHAQPDFVPAAGSDGC